MKFNRAECRWNGWTRQHIGEHGVVPEEVEWVIRTVRRPYPEHRGDGKWRVCGRTRDGRYLHIIFVLDPPDVIYVIHAREMTDDEKRRYRKRRR